MSYIFEQTELNAWESLLTCPELPELEYFNESISLIPLDPIEMKKASETTHERDEPTYAPIQEWVDHYSEDDLTVEIEHISGEMNQKVSKRWL